ncbi:MAG: DUF4852 domain-containing protein [Tenuifilum sp.]|uniref:DUF4852 domain-containing protein n=1 Tax=Tenuifilum sp. TaxID=2760880 RepID=UPI001B7B16D4|nr:DUF4852 domain-containing protein [Bacteroidales bacterium]
MKKSIFLSILITIAKFSFCQDYTESTEPYTAKNGYIFKVGDTIYITEPKNFANEFTSIYDNKSLTNKRKYLEKNEYSNGTISYYDHIYRKYLIKSFIDHPSGEKIARLKNFLQPIYVSINKAIENDEIANCNPLYFKSVFLERNYLTDSVAFMEYIARESNISNNIIEEYLFLFRNNYYNIIRKDEFEFHKGLKNTKEEFKKFKEKIDSNKVYSVFTEVELGKYDFDTETFPILLDFNSFEIHSRSGYVFLPTNIEGKELELSNLYLLLTNIDEFKNLPLSTDKANAFVKSNKDEKGNVNRKVYIIINYKITGIDTNKENAYRNLRAEIQSIDFFASFKEEGIDYHHWWLNRIEKTK